jgi:hypothetical protein
MTSSGPEALRHSGKRWVWLLWASPLAASGISTTSFLLKGLAG